MSCRVSECSNGEERGARAVSVKVRVRVRRTQRARAFNLRLLRCVAHQTTDKLSIVWPTVEEVRTSTEGYGAGGSIPGPSKNVGRDFLQRFYCKCCVRACLWCAWRAERECVHQSAAVVWRAQKLCFFANTASTPPPLHLTIRPASRPHPIP